MKRVPRVLVTAMALAVSAAPVAAAAPPEESDRLGLQERLDNIVAAGAVGADPTSEERAPCAADATEPMA